MPANRVKNRKWKCNCNGCVAPNAVCGSVSVYSDDKGHRCMAHGNVKCKHKELINIVEVKNA